MSWTRRVHRPAVPLQEVQAAAQNLAGQAGYAPDKVRLVFQTVADVALLGTVLISGALATVHLYKALFPRHREEHPGPEPAGADRSPPHRRGPRATASAGDRRGYDEDDQRSR